MRCTSVSQSHPKMNKLLNSSPYPSLIPTTLLNVSKGFLKLIKIKAVKSAVSFVFALQCLHDLISKTFKTSKSTFGFSRLVKPSYQNIELQRKRVINGAHLRLYHWKLRCLKMLNSIQLPGKGKVNSWPKY